MQAASTIAAEETVDPTTRRSIATGARLPRDRMLRLVVGPDGAIVPDVAGTLPGRGMWLEPSRDALRTAERRRQFAHAAKQAVTVPADLALRIETLLVRRVLDLLGIARRAGLVILSRRQIEEEIARGRVGLILVARDAGTQGSTRLGALAGDTPTSLVLTREELGQALGRNDGAYVGVRRGTLARRIAADALRLEGFRGDSTAAESAITDRNP